MASRVKNLIRFFGVVDGMKFYTRFKTGKMGWYQSSEKNIRFFLRDNKTDVGIFGQVFTALQYKLPIDIKPLTILDLGANTGLATLYFAALFPGAKIIGVEPDQENFDIAVLNTKAYNNVSLLKKAIWNKDTLLEIVDTGAKKDTIMVREAAVSSPHTIEAITIDTICENANWPSIDILKIDIEGAEKELFSSGFENWLPRTKILFVEVHDDMKKGSSKSVFNAVSKYNFRFTMQHENLVFINEDI